MQNLQNYFREVTKQTATTRNPGVGKRIRALISMLDKSEYVKKTQKQKHNTSNTKKQRNMSHTQGEK